MHHAGLVGDHVAERLVADQRTRRAVNRRDERVLERGGHRELTRQIGQDEFGLAAGRRGHEHVLASREGPVDRGSAATGRRGDIVERRLAQSPASDALHGGRADPLVEPGIGPVDRRNGGSGISSSECSHRLRQ